MRKQSDSLPPYKQLITQLSPGSAMAEAYRTLRTNLDFAGVDLPFKSILITSANADEGKSTIVSNLGVVLAQAGHRVVLVDCDLRKPVQHQIFQLKNNQGFTSCIAQQVDVDSVAHRGMNNHLTVLTSGPIPPNPAELLTSKRTHDFLDNLSNDYDYILIDSPPILAVADAAILSTRVDGVILVISAGNTRIDDAQKAKAQLNRAKARIIGVVMNQVKLDESQYYYYASDRHKVFSG